MADFNNTQKNEREADFNNTQQNKHVADFNKTQKISARLILKTLKKDSESLIITSKIDVS